MPRLASAEGWGWPPASRKAHYFVAGDARSICGGWLYTGELEDVQTGASADDCKKCARLSAKRKEATDA